MRKRLMARAMSPVSEAVRLPSKADSAPLILLKGKKLRAATWCEGEVHLRGRRGRKPVDAVARRVARAPHELATVVFDDIHGGVMRHAPLLGDSGMRHGVHMMGRVIWRRCAGRSPGVLGF